MGSVGLHPETASGWFEPDSGLANRAASLSTLIAGEDTKIGRDAFGKRLDVGDNLADFGVTLESAGCLSAVLARRMSCSLPRFEAYPVRRKTEAIAGQIKLRKRNPCSKLFR